MRGTLLCDNSLSPVGRGPMNDFANKRSYSNNLSTIEVFIDWSRGNTWPQKCRFEHSLQHWTNPFWRARVIEVLVFGKDLKLSLGQVQAIYFLLLITTSAMLKIMEVTTWRCLGCIHQEDQSLKNMQPLLICMQSNSSAVERNSEILGDSIILQNVGFSSIKWNTSYVTFRCSFNLFQPKMNQKNVDMATSSQIGHIPFNKSRT